MQSLIDFTSVAFCEKFIERTCSLAQRLGMSRVNQPSKGMFFTLRQLRIVMIMLSAGMATLSEISVGTKIMPRVSLLMKVSNSTSLVMKKSLTWALGTVTVMKSCRYDSEPSWL